jgi:hypothetical protein
VLATCRRGHAVDRRVGRAAARPCIADHDHAEHHHGPATHVHAAAVHRHADDGATPRTHARVEGCDPAEHLVSVVFTYVVPDPPYAPRPVVMDRFELAAPTSVAVVVAESDVRVHSPPRLTDAPLRAPPLVNPA